MNSNPRIPFTKTNASVLLDLTRGISALLVCLEHWRNLLYVDYRSIESHRAFFAIAYVMTDAGHQAVVIFFVLSGYLISRSIFRNMQHEHWSWTQYLTHRLVRLWIVLVPALILGALLDYAGIHLHLAPALYAGQTTTHMIGNVANSARPLIFAGNLVFIQGILVTTFGSNTPLWSLANEFWYYILFPFALLALRRGTQMTSRILNALAFGGLAWFVGREILLLFPIWLMGTVLALVPAPRVKMRLLIAAALVYCPLFFFLAKTNLVRGVLSDYILGLATFVFVWLLLGSRSEAPVNRGVQISRTVARFSYSLYLLHVPFLIFLKAMVGGESRWQPDARHVLFGLVILSLTMAYAFTIASATEFRTDQVRGWVEGKILMLSGGV